MRLLALVVAVLTFVPASSAGAAAVSLAFRPATAGGQPAAWEARIQSGREETNHLIVSTEPGAFTVLETRGLLLAGENCVAREDRSVRCAATDAPDLLMAVHMTLADQPDDVVVTGPLAIEVDGRGGNDRLEAGADVPSATLAGGAGDDVLIGTPGPDRLDGGPGRDVVVAGAGDDEVTEGDDAPAASDVLDGGAGRDRLSYVGRRGGVVADLTAPTAGEAGEADAITGFESASGGDGPDVLLGDGGPNELLGGRGADRLDGRGGDDVLEAGAPRVLPGSEGDGVTGGAGADKLTVWPGDVVHAGPGDDQLTRAGARLGPPAAVDCGPGADTFTGAEEPGVGCEALVVAGRGTARDVRVGRDAISLRWVDGPEGATPCGIAAHAVDARSGRALGPVARVRTVGGVARVRVRVTAFGPGRAVAVALSRATSCRGARWPTITMARVYPA